MIYIGEVKEGTDDTPHGIGIQVNEYGGIQEGYWKDWQLYGRGRRINGNGDYYIGEFKGGSYNGEGTYYYPDGDIKYEGGWKDDKLYGQGTLYHWNGHKYTGQWDDYKGQGEINYKDGKKYTGQWDWFKRHGLGTLYSAEGQVLNQGKWKKNKYKGKE